MHALKQAPGLTVGQGLVIEGVVTFNLVAVALFVTIPGKHTKLATLAIGFVKGTGLLAAVSLQFIRVKC
jgi:glycerol uptake facilitator-like aquaporin